MSASLGPGSRLGSYEIVELLGEGGMGTVFRARDSRLGRDVAIKVVRAVFAGDPERAARFGREARLLASLNHPNVAMVHGLEESDGITLLVLELVEGPTLSERLRDGSLPVREALTLAVQIAAALEAAHDRHIIHRDLKPANIKITPAGTVKVLDFGLAKALAIDGTAAFAQQPTLSAGGTGEGTILGTAAYMSPEQARGKEVDKRSDIWSFGCVLFDMLTAQHAFSGDTLSDTLAAILTREPDWTLLPADLPAPIRRLLRRCLDKDTGRRLRDIADARFDLEDALSSSSDSGAGSAAPALPPARATPMPSRRWRPAGLIAGVLGIAAALTVVMLWPNRGTPGRPVVQFSLRLPPGDRLSDVAFHVLAISPADTHIAYVVSQRGRTQLFLRPLSALEEQPVPGTEGALNPFFSPDGEWIAFFAAGRLRKVSIRGGAVRDIADAEIGFGGTWSPDGTIVFAPSNASPLMRVSADGGTPEPVTTLDTARREFSHRWPELLPDGKSVLFTIGTVGDWDDADIAIQPLSGGKRRILVEGGTFPRYSTTGHVLYARRGSVYALPVNRRTFEVAGTSTAVLGNVLQSVDGAAQFAVSGTGSAVYLPSAGGVGRTLVWVDRAGNVQPLPAAPGAYAAPRLSPDGRSLALAVGPDPEQVFTYSIPENRFVEVTFNGGAWPVWSSDGQRIFYSAARGSPPNVFVKAADASGGEQRLTKSERAQLSQSAVPGDGGLLFVELDPSSGRNISLLKPDGTIRSLFATPADEGAPAASPDGRAVAYVSDDTGRPEVFVAPLNDNGRRVQVSSGGGTEPVWRRDGSELFFRSGNRLMVARVSTRPAVSVTSVNQLFDVPFQAGTAGSPAYDVSGDGMRFIMLRPNPSSTEQRDLRVFLGWTERLKP